MMIKFQTILKMVECNSIEASNIYIYPNLNDQQSFRLNKISEVREYFLLRLEKEN